MTLKKRREVSSYHKKKFYTRLLQEEEKSNKIAPAFILIAILSLTLFFGSNVDITGFATYGAPVDSKILTTLENETHVNVLIELKSPLTIASTDSEKQLIKEKQNLIRTQTASIDLEDIELKQSFNTFPFIAAKVSITGVNELKKNKNIKSIQFDNPKTLLLQNSVPFINANSVHSIQIQGTNLTGEGQTICIIDSGINYNHSSLGGPGFPNSKVIAGHDFENNDADPIDDYGHGTHVAGIAAANGSILGVAPQAKIVAIKAFDDSGVATTANLVSALEYCTLNKTTYNISVIVMSYGSGSSTRWDDVTTCLADQGTDLETIALNNAFEANITLVAAAGNSGLSDGIQYPACHPKVISVGNSNLQDEKNIQSNTGLLLDIFAPGTSINSTWFTGDTNYNTLSGTSMAAPHVAGSVALIKQREQTQNNTPSLLSIKKSLFSTTESIVTTPKTYPRLDVHESINSLFDISGNSISNSVGGVTFSSSVDYSNISAAFTITQNLIEFDENYPEYNIPSNLSLSNLPYTFSPILYRNGVICSNPQCNITSYDGTLNFTVGGFSNYTTGANSQLEIYDQNDADKQFANVTKGVNLTFFANYTNSTDNSVISTGDCNISFLDINSTMSYNATSTLFEYSRNFTLAGDYTYNISCADTAYETLSLVDSVEILTSCATPPDGINWTIPANTQVLCDQDQITFSNQVLLMGSNTTLTLNFTTFNYSFGTARTLIEDSNTSTIIFNNSVIRGDNVAATLSVSGNAILNNFTLDNTALSTAGTISATNTNFSKVELLGSSITNITDSTYTGDNTDRFELQGESILNAQNLTFDGDVRLSSTAVANLQDSTLVNEVRLGGTSTLNATSQSIVNTTSFTIEFNTQPIVDGYWTFFSTPSISALATLYRYYPISINYTNGDPVSGATVNVTNSTNGLIQQTTSNSSGNAKILLNFTLATATNQYNVSVNPTQTTLLNTSTQLVFILATPDTTAPNVTLLSPPNNTVTSNISITFAFNSTDDNETDNCSIYLDGILNQTNVSVIDGVNEFTIGEISPGVHNWNIQCSDVNANSNTTQNFTFTIDAAGPIVQLQTPTSSEFNTNTINLTFNATDALTTIDNCTLYINNSIDQTDLTITQTVFQNFTTTQSDGTYSWNVSCSDGFGFETFTNSRTFEIDSTSPLFSGETQSIANNSVYEGSSIMFNITVQDVNLETVTFEFDGVNYTPLVNGDEYYFTVPNPGAGSYNYIWFANDTFANTNNTGSLNYAITQAVPDLHLFLEGIEGNVGVSFGDASNATATSADITPALLRNDSAVTNPEITSLAAGEYNYTASFAGNQNYSARNVSYTLSVPKIPTSCNIMLDKLPTQTYNTSLTANCSCNNAEAPSTLYKDTVNITALNGTAVIHEAGSFTLTCNTTSTQNYTSGTFSTPITINKATPILALISDPGVSFTYGTPSNESCTINTPQATPGLFLNNTGVSIPHITTLGAGTYNYTCNVSQTQNYTAQEVFELITVNKASSEVNLTLNGVSSDVSVAKNNNVTINGSLVTPTSGNLDLYDNGSLINSGSSPISNITNRTVEGEFLINLSYAGNQNYTSSFETHNITVLDSSTPIVNLISPVNTAQSNNPEQELTFIVEDSDSSIDNCTLYINNTLNQTESLITEGVNQNFTLNFTDGTYSWIVGCVDDSISNNAANSSSRTFEIDATAPTFNSNLTSEPSGINYDPSLTVQFNITVTDAHLSNVVFEFDGTNYTPLNSGSEYYFTVPSLGAGSYNYRWYANDTFTNSNQTAQGTFVVSQSVPVINLTLNTLAADLGVTYNTTTTALASSSDVTVSLLRNESVVSNPEATILAAGVYNYTSSFAGNQNYSAINVSHILTINKASSAVTLQLSPSSSLITSSPPTNYYLETWGAVCNPLPSFLSSQLEVNSTIVGTPYNTVLAAGTYNFTCSVFGNDNYTSDTFSQEIIVVKLTPNITLELNNISNNIGVNTNDNVSVWVNLSINENVNVTWQGNNYNYGLPPLTNTTTPSTAGSYVVLASFAGNQNYSTASVSYTVTVSTPSTGGSGGSGGGGSSGSCTEIWECGDWSSCKSNEQTRDCVKTKNCYKNTPSPNTTQYCAVAKQDFGGSYIPPASKPKASCFDGFKNQNEEGVDCGGDCDFECKKEPVKLQPLPVASTCGDGICSLDETCECFEDCAPKNEILVLIIILILAGIHAILRDKGDDKTPKVEVKEIKKEIAQVKPVKKDKPVKKSVKEKPKKSFNPFAKESSDPVQRYANDMIRQGRSKEDIKASMKKVGFSDKRINEVLK